jgi:hypothetical protein
MIFLVSTMTIPISDSQIVSCVLTLYRNPTLSYTQRLEQKVAKLEEALLEARRSSNESRINLKSDVDTSDMEYRPRAAPSTVVERPIIEATGALPLNDSISLFKLPSSVRALTIQKTQVDMEVATNKEALVNSAWRERVYERLADTPVC